MKKRSKYGALGLLTLSFVLVHGAEGGRTFRFDPEKERPTPALKRTSKSRAPFLEAENLEKTGVQIIQSLLKAIPKSKKTYPLRRARVKAAETALRRFNPEMEDLPPAVCLTLISECALPDSFLTTLYVRDPEMRTMLEKIYALDEILRDEKERLEDENMEALPAHRAHRAERAALYEKLLGMMLPVLDYDTWALYAPDSLREALQSPPQQALPPMSVALERVRGSGMTSRQRRQA